MTKPPPPDPVLWRCTGRAPLMHTYERDKPYPGNMLAPDTGRKIEGTIKYMVLLDFSEEDRPDEIEIHVCPTAKIGFPDEDQPVMKEGKRLFPECWQRFTYLRSDMAEIVEAVTLDWINERQEELEDVSP